MEKTKKIMFNRLNPYGNFILDDKSYVNGDMLTVGESVADGLIKANIAFDVNENPELTKKVYTRIKKENELRTKVLKNVEKRRR